MPKKKAARKPAHDKPSYLSSLLIPYTVGSGITKRVQYRLSVDKLGNDDKPPHITEKEWTDICLRAWRAITPEQNTYNNLENMAKQILEAAKLPTADSVYSIPDGRPLSPEEWKTYPGRRGTLLSLAEAKGYHERINIEWYAAKILGHFFALRACLEKGMPNAAVMIAFALGMLAREMAIRFEVIAGYTQKGGSQKKRLPVIVSFVRSRFRKNNSLTSRDLWGEVPEGQDDALKIGNRKKVYRDKERLCFIEKINGHWIKSDRSLTFASFRKYVTDARKSFAR